jgi:hypothetical protein
MGQEIVFGIGALALLTALIYGVLQYHCMGRLRLSSAHSANWRCYLVQSRRHQRYDLRNWDSE